MKQINTFILMSLFLGTLAGCSASEKAVGREQCASALDSAWEHMDIAKTKGFAGTVSYTKAMALLSTAKTQQTVEAFDSCQQNAEKAEYYITESMKGQ